MRLSRKTFGFGPSLAATVIACIGISAVFAGVNDGKFSTSGTLDKYRSLRPNDTLPADEDERFRGLVTPNKQVVLTAPVDGMITKILVEESSPIVKDQPLVTMDDVLQNLVVKTATLTQAEAEIDLTNWKRAREKNSAADWEVRRAQLQFEQAVANRELEYERLVRYTLKAPFDGHLIRRSTTVGATVTRQDQIVSIAQLDPLEAQLFLPIELYGKLRVGRGYELNAEAPINKIILGKLKTVDPVIDAASRTFRCVFTIKNPESKLPAGFTVRLKWPQKGTIIEEAEPENEASADEDEAKAEEASAETDKADATDAAESK